ncbi:hypothetical protein TYRP_023257 [Tyrophagus putrescentiae]|nr:hypothetical protein TYRP_023257 [Tyrophagus putrescentiae]
MAAVKPCEVKAPSWAASSFALFIVVMVIFTFTTPTIFFATANAQRPLESSSSSSSSYNRSYSTYSSSPNISPSSIPNSRFRSLECRSDVLPQRADIVPHGVVFSGTVTEVRQDGGQSTGSDHEYSATVLVRRVFFGPRSLRRSHVTVAGFGDRARNWCHANVRCGDSWIFVLVPITFPDYFRLNASLVRMNLHALERMEGIIADEPYRRLTSVEEYPCEKKYCKNNANCLEDKYSPDGTKCECLNYCKPNYAPVLASNNETYSNECEVRLKSCYAAKNWFLKSSSSPCASSSSSSSYGRSPPSASSSSSSPPPSSSSGRNTATHYSSSYSPSSPPGGGSSSYSYSYRSSSSDSRSPGSSPTSYTSSSSSSSSLPIPPYSPHRDHHHHNLLNRPDTSRTYSRTVTTNTITRTLSS